MNQPLELTVEKIIPAPRKDVFQAWLDPESLAKFMTPADGMTVPKAETDPQVGGAFLIVMKAGDQELPHRGVYQEIVEPEKLVFTWESSHAPKGSTVTLTFTELGPKQTKVTLHHAGLGSPESRDNHEAGWGRILDGLGPVLS